MGRAARKVRFEDDLAELGMPEEDEDEIRLKKRNHNSGVMANRGVMVGWYSIVEACQIAAKRHDADWIDVMRTFYASTDDNGNGVVKADNEYGLLVLPDWFDRIKKQVKAKKKGK